MGQLRVEVGRGGEVESVHHVDLVVVDAADRTVASAGGDPELFARSAVKPFQAIPLVEDGVVERLEISDPELALCCASHSGEPAHVDAATSLLARAGLGRDALACGPHEPFHVPSARALHRSGEEAGRIHNNCSGKHAGMLALASVRGWSTEGYHEATHPVQRRVRDEVARWTGMAPEALGSAVDGCGVVTFRLTLRALARAYARLAGACAEPGSPAGRIVQAMTAHPLMVAGTGRLGTRLLERTSGRVVAKVGAEGVFGVALVDRGWGLALKVRDGATRAAGPALLGALEALGLLTPDEMEGLADAARPEVRNTRDEVVGRIRPVVELSDGG